MEDHCKKSKDGSLWNCIGTEISSTCFHFTSVIVQVGITYCDSKKIRVLELVLFHGYAPLFEFAFLQQISQNLIHEYAK